MKKAFGSTPVPSTPSTRPWVSTKNSEGWVESAVRPVQQEIVEGWDEARAEHGDDILAILDVNDGSAMYFNRKTFVATKELMHTIPHPGVRERISHPARLVPGHIGSFWVVVGMGAMCGCVTLQVGATNSNGGSA